MKTYLQLIAAALIWLLANVLLFMLLIVSLPLLWGAAYNSLTIWVSVFLSSGASGYVAWLLSRVLRFSFSQRQLVITLSLLILLWNGSSVLSASDPGEAQVRLVSVLVAWVAVLISWRLGWSRDVVHPIRAKEA
jgi:hypothetical protein